MIDTFRTTSATLLAVATLSAALAVADERPTPAERPPPARARHHEPDAAAASKPSKTQKKAAPKKRAAAASERSTGDKKPAKPCEEVKPCAID